MEYDNFLHFSRQLQMANALGDVYVHLSTLKTAKSQFMFTRSLLHKHKMLTTTLFVDVEYNNEATSTNIRQKGNEFFKAKELWKAVDTYCVCLTGSDPSSEWHALALGNRAAAYFHLGMFEACLKDVRTAMMSHYPNKLAYKLYERAGKAECMLGLAEQAKESFTECLKRLDEVDMSAENKCKFREPIDIALAQCEARLEEQKKKKVPPAEQLVGGKNENIPALSAFVELKMSKDMGRGVYATHDINPGDVVAIDEPYICGPIADHTEVCHYSGCLKLDVALFPCPRCFLVFYCNKDCMKKAEKEGHYYECPIMHFIKTTPGITRMNELAMKWFLKEYLRMGPKKYCVAVNNFFKSKIDPKTRGFDENGQYQSDNFLAAYSLDSGEDKLSIDVLFFFNCIAVSMMHYLILSDFFEIPESCLGIVGASFVRILTVLDLNCRKININAPSLSFHQVSPITLTIAFTLYPTISLFNHSCDPNIKRSGELTDRVRVMKAIQPIPKGTQLFCSYGVMFRGHDKETRQKLCKDLFKFDCRCPPCKTNWPSCHYIPNRLSTLNLLNPTMANTVQLECKKFLEFSKSVKPEDYRQHLNYLYSFIKLLFNNVKRPFKLYEDCLEMIYNAHTMHTDEVIRVCEFPF